MSAEAPRSDQAELSAGSSDIRPTRIRIGVAAVLTLMACLLYLDRFAVGIASEYIREDLRMTQTQMSWFLSAFFWSYALSQVPSGWLSDRFGPRLMLTLYILAWSAFTGLLGLAVSVWLVLHLRLYMGAAQAGAFPVCGGLIRAWFPVSQRGTASSIIALGGRAGGVLAPILTAWLIVAFATNGPVPDFDETDVLNDREFFSSLQIYSDEPSVAPPLMSGVFSRCPELRNSIPDGGGGPSLVLISPWSFLEDWYPNAAAQRAQTERNTKGIERILGYFNSCLDEESLVTRDNTLRLTLSPRAQQLLNKREAGTKLTENETRLLNRLAIEAAMPKQMKKFFGRG